MHSFQTLCDVYALALNHLLPDDTPGRSVLPALPDLLIATTGDDPFFASQERLALPEAAVVARQAHPWFDFPLRRERRPLPPMLPVLADLASNEMKAALCIE